MALLSILIGCQPDTGRVAISTDDDSDVLDGVITGTETEDITAPVEGTTPDEPEEVALFEGDLEAYSSGQPVRITGDVYLTEMASIADLSTLSCVVRIDGDLDLYNNPDLTSLAGLENLEHIGGSRLLNLHPVLSDADAWALVDAVGEANIVGNITIEDNGG